MDDNFSSNPNADAQHEANLHLAEEFDPAAITSALKKISRQLSVETYLGCAATIDIVIAFMEDWEYPLSAFETASMFLHDLKITTQDWQDWSDLHSIK